MNDKGWQLVTLGTYLSESSERKRNSDRAILSVTNNGGLVAAESFFGKQVFSQDTTGYKIVRYGDLAYNPSRADVGSIAHCDLPDGGAVSPMYIVVRCGPLLSSKFLFYFLRSDYGRQYIRHMSAGSVRNVLRFADLATMQMKLPPLRDQERFAAYIAEANSLQRLRAEASDQMKKLFDSVFLKHFGDPFISHNSKWSTSTVGSEAVLLEYGPRFANEGYSSEGTRVARITDLGDFGALNFDSMPRLRIDFKTLSRWRLLPGDIIFARSGATVGRVGLVPPDPEECIPGAYFVRLRFSERILPKYALGLLQLSSVKKYIRERAQQSTQMNFSGPSIRELPMRTPPIELQNEYVAQIEELEELIQLQVAAKGITHDAVHAMEYYVFSGDS